MHVVPSRIKHPASWPRAHYAAGKLPRQHAQTRSPRNSFICHWATDGDDENTTSDHRNGSDSNKDPMTTRRRINSLLQIQSLQSVEDLHTADAAHHVGDERQSPVLQQEQTVVTAAELQDCSVNAAKGASEGLNSSPGPRAYTLFDDPAVEDYDPFVLDMLGFTSVSHYLNSKLSQAAGEAKVSLAAVAIWSLMAAAAMVPLGGASAYTDSISILTDGGLEMGNLLFLWVALLTYFSAKGCIMAFATSFMSWRLHEAQGTQLEELATMVEAEGQRRAFWKLQQCLQTADERAKRTYLEFALSSLLLGVLLLMSGGTDNLELQLETVDHEAYLNLLVILWLFWEAYFSTVVCVLKVSQWAGAMFAKWQYERKWGASLPGQDKE